MFTIVIFLSTLAVIGLIIWGIYVVHQALGNRSRNRELQDRVDTLEEVVNVLRGGLQEVIINPDSSPSIAIAALDEAHQSEKERIISAQLRRN